MKNDPTPDLHRHLFPAKGSGAHDLLTVLLGPEAAAREAWERWLTAHNFDDLEAPMLRLVMMALPTLTRYGLSTPDQPRIKGLARRTFYTTMMQWKAVCEVSSLLGAEGIPVMIFKGLPLSAELYEPGERYSADADVLIRRADYQRARVLLESHKDIKLQHPDRTFNPEIDNGEEWSIGAAQLDIHVQLCHEFAPGQDVEIQIWDRARPIANLPTVQDWVHPPLMPSAEDMLLQLAVSQTRWDRSPHGLVDIVKLLKHEGAALNWNRLTADAIAHRVSLRVAAVLDFLRDEFAAPVTCDQIARLSRAALSFEANELIQISKPTRWHILRWYWFFFRRRNGANGAPPLNVIRFAWFLAKARGRKAPAIAFGYLRRALSEIPK